MKDITTIVNENRKEAIQIVKAKGGRIDFVIGIENDLWDENPNEFSLPWVIVAYDEYLIDTAVLAVRTNGDLLEFLAFDVVAGSCYGWVSYAECCSNTDNEVYMFLEENN